MNFKRKSLSIDDKLWSQVVKLASAEKRSASQFIRIVLEKYITSLKGRKK